MKTWEGREKGILRRALQGILPDDILFRKKSPYPKTHNPSYQAAVRERVLQILDDRTSPMLPLINTCAVRAIAKLEEDAFDRPWFGQLMTGSQFFGFLIQLDAWLRQYNVVLC